MYTKQTKVLSLTTKLLKMQSKPDLWPVLYLFCTL